MECEKLQLQDLCLQEDQSYNQKIKPLDEEIFTGFKRVTP